MNEEPLKRAILIDPCNKEIKEIQIRMNTTLDDFYKYMNCELVQFLISLADGFVIVVDEEGSFKPNNPMFEIALKRSPYYEARLFGKTIITGLESTALKDSVTVEHIRALIKWL